MFSIPNMEGMWSLLFFTVLVQASAGMVIIQSIVGGEKALQEKTWSYVALGFGAFGTIFSMLHLSDPWVSYYTLTNITTSWLSREIVSVSTFGGLVLAFVFLRMRILLILAALAGLVLIYVMSCVYMLQTNPFWNGSFTLCIFTATSFLLGGVTLLALDIMMQKKPSFKALTGWIPTIIVLALVIRIVSLPLQILKADDRIDIAMLDFSTMFTMLGAGLMLHLLMKRGLVAASNGAKSAHLNLYAFLLLLFVWIGEFCGRILFYQGYTYFGM